MIIIKLHDGEVLAYPLQDAVRYLYQAGHENNFADIADLKVLEANREYFGKCNRNLRAVIEEFTVPAEPVEGGFIR